MKAALQINERIAKDLSETGLSNKYQYAVRYMGRQHGDIFDVSCWREDEADHHKIASDVVSDGIKNLLTNGVQRDLKLEDFIDPSEVCFVYMTYIFCWFIKSLL